MVLDMAWFKDGFENCIYYIMCEKKGGGGPNHSSRTLLKPELKFESRGQKSGLNLDNRIMTLNMHLSG